MSWLAVKQAVKRNVMMASRSCLVADGGAVLLGNAITVFHGAWCGVFRECHG